MEKFIDIKTSYEDDCIKVEYVVSKPLSKVLSVIFSGGNELFTTDREFMDCTKKLLCNNYTKVIELNQCVKKVYEVFDYLDKSGTPVDLNGCSVLDFVELFFRPVLSLTKDDSCKCVYDTLYVPRTDCQECIESLSDFIPVEIIDKLKNSLKLTSITFANSDNSGILETLLFALKYDEKPKDIFTYIMSDKSGLYKIGRTTNVDKRLKMLECGNTTIKIVKVIKGDYENFLHKTFKDKRMQGEWFNLSDNDFQKLNDLIKDE